MMARPLRGVDRSAVLGLAVACVGWGWSFPAMQWSLHDMAAAVPDSTPLGRSAALLAWRFGLAALLYGALTWRDQRGYLRRTTWGGTITGLVCAVGLFAQIVGLAWTSPAVSGFLTATYVILVPFAQRLLFGTRLPPRVLAAVAVALVGMVTLAVAVPTDLPTTTAPPWPFLGEALTVVGAALFTAQILMLDHFGREASTVQLTTIMFVAVAVASLLVGLTCGGLGFFTAEGLRASLASPRLGPSLLSLTLLSSVVSFHLMTRYQVRLEPTVAGVIYCMEPVFATLLSVVTGSEPLRAELLAGGALIVLATVLVSTMPSRTAPAG